MAIRFRIRSILILTAVVAVGMCVIAKPVFDRNAESQRLERLSDRQLPPNLSPIIVSCLRSIPTQLLQSPLRRFHKKETFERVHHLSLAKVDNEIIDDICGFHYLRNLDLSGTALTNEQAMMLADKLPCLEILDCGTTRVDYQTLLEMRRKHPQLCHLAHRNAVTNLYYNMCYLYPDPQPAPSGVGTTRHVEIDLTKIDAKVIRAIKHIGRPISTLRVSHADRVDQASLAQLCETRDDFDLHMDIRPIGRHERHIPKSITEFQNIANPRVKRVQLANIAIDGEYRIPRNRSYDAVSFESCATNVLQAFVDTDVPRMHLYQMAGPLNQTTIPSSLKDLHLFYCEIPTSDLSHCSELVKINIGGEIGSSVTSEFLKSLLTVPNLQKVRLPRLLISGDSAQKVVDEYDSRNIELDVNRRASGLRP